MFLSFCVYIAADVLVYTAGPICLISAFRVLAVVVSSMVNILSIIDLNKKPLLLSRKKERKKGRKEEKELMHSFGTALFVFSMNE